LGLLFGFLSLNAQNNISGTVVSEKFQKSIEYASVYIDGTSKGTTTDLNGHFTIKNLNYPCRLVVSCVGYELKSIQLSDASEEDLNIALKEKFEQLSGISVNGKNRRKQNLELFKTFFLGDDKWGQHGKLTNEEGLLFEHQYDTIKLKNSLKATEYIHSFNVKTSSSLTVKLPLLGYDAAVDIVSFSVKTNSNNQTTEYDMYTRFSPYDFTSERQRKKIEDNRREVYYNSSIYFCRSLFNNQLKKNGFVAVTPNRYTPMNQIKTIEFDIMPYVFKKSKDEIAIVGLKGKTIKLHYYYNNKKCPINMQNLKITEGKPVFPWGYSWNERISYMTFLSDDCILYKNGTALDNNIVFSGDMATYVGGHLLPLDYDLQDSLNSEKLVADNFSVSPLTDLNISKPHGELEPETSQEVNIKKITKQIQSFAVEYPQEKTYLHFDNTSYYLGETMWFKAYVVRADHNNLTSLSKVLYLELLNAEGHVLDTRKLKIENGQCHGDFKLNPAQYGGFYEVRAYTRYMLNFGDGNIFSRVFPVYDKPKKEGEYKTVITERAASQRIEQKRPTFKQNHKLELSFFPEGGSLINGIRTKVAFRATTDKGEAAVVNCTLLKNMKDSIYSFSTLNEGMGSFEFCPDTSTYTAVANWKGKQYHFPLQQVIKSGITMSVDNSDENDIYILITKTSNLKNQHLGVTISCRGVQYGSDEFELNSDNELSLNFPKRKLPSGVTQITLFDAQGKILSERLLFVNHHSNLKFNASQSKNQYQSFEPISMSFDLKDKQNKPIETTFSLSVRDAGTCSMQPHADNVLIDLLLSSELKGYIANPSYYFESDSSERQAALDLLLLIQGWSRYSWKQMARVEKIEHKQPLEDGLYLDGSVVSLFMKRPKPNMNFSMILLGDSVSQHGSCKTDSAGNFSFALKDFSGSARLILQTKDGQKKEETFIKLNRQFSPALKSYSLAEQNEKQIYKAEKDTVIAINTTVSGFDEELNKLLPKNNNKLPMTQRNNLIKQVTVKAKGMPVKVSAKYEVEKEMDRRTDEAEWLPADLNTLLNFSCKYFVQSNNGPNGESTAKYKGKNVIFIVENSKQIVSDANSLLDGNEEQNPFSTDTKPTNESYQQENKELKWRMPNLDEIESITFIEDYASIFRLYKGGYIEPSTTCIGLIKLKKNYIKETYSMRNTNFDGYSVTRLFFSPQYDKIVMPDEKDYRRTLYWNPDVRTDKNGKATVTFYNNGSCKLMLISAETVTTNGLIGVLNK